MQCPNCQAEVSPGSAFCGFCGARMSKRAPTIPAVPFALSTDKSTGKPAPAAESNEEASSYIGKIIDRRYQIISLVARGGMGTVYKVVQVHMRKILAMKLLHEHMLSRTGLVARFMREARAVSRLSDPHTIRIYDFGKHREVFYLAMEFLDGEDLFSVLAREGPFDVERTLSIIDQACSSLNEAHTQGIVHRDLKTENLMILKDTEGRDFVKVLDFGLAKVADPKEPITAKSEQDLFGTPYYMSPEQIRGRTVDKRTDVYALGALAFRMLTNDFPYNGDTAFDILRSHLVDSIPSMRHRKYKADVPKWIDDIVKHCLAKDPEHRYGTVLELREAIRKAAAQELPKYVLPSDIPGRRVPTILSLEKDGDDEQRKPTGPLEEQPTSTRKENVYDPSPSVREAQRSRRKVYARRFFTLVLWLFVFASLGVLGWEKWFSNPENTGGEVEPNNTVSTAHQIKIGDSVAGMIGRRLSATSPDTDYYRATLPPSGKAFLDVHLTPIPNADLILEVRDDAGILLANVDREGVGEDEIVKRLPARGAFVTLQVSAKKPERGKLPIENVSDTYRLWTRESGVISEEREEVEQNDTFKRSQTISKGLAIQGSLDSPGDIDYFAPDFASNAPAIVSFSISGALGLPIELRLSDSNDRALFSHVFSGQEDYLPVYVARTWDSGKTVYVSLRVAGGLRASGKYFLSFQEAEAAFAAEREPNQDGMQAQVLVYNAKQHGKLDSEDPVDVYRFASGGNDDTSLILKIEGLGRRVPNLFIRPVVKVKGKGADSKPSLGSREKLQVKRKRGQATWKAEYVLPAGRKIYQLNIENASSEAKIRYEITLSEDGFPEEQLVDFFP